MHDLQSDAGAAPPQTLEQLRQEIVRQYELASRRMKQVASFILDKPEDAAFETLAVVAERAGVQPSTIVRFAKSLGYPGASQMQKMIRDELLASHLTLGYGERAKQFRQHSEPPGDVMGDGILDEYVEADTVSLARLRQSIGKGHFDQAVGAISDAATVYVAGFRRAFPPAAYLAYALQRAGKKTIFVDGTGGLWENQMRSIGRGDLLIAISFRPYAEETVQCHALAHARGANVLSITDSDVSPLAKGSGQTLYVREAEVRAFRSLTATFCLIQSLVIACAFAAEGGG